MNGKSDVICPRKTDSADIKKKNDVVDICNVNFDKEEWNYRYLIHIQANF